MRRRISKLTLCATTLSQYVAQPMASPSAVGLSSGRKADGRQSNNASPSIHPANTTGASRSTSTANALLTVMTSFIEVFPRQWDQIQMRSLGHESLWVLNRVTGLVLRMGRKARVGEGCWVRCWGVCCAEVLGFGGVGTRQWPFLVKDKFRTNGLLGYPRRRRAQHTSYLRNLLSA